MRNYYKCISSVCLLFMFLLDVSAAVAEINSKTLAIILNSNDPYSREVAKYYKNVRAIPERNMIYVQIPYDSSTLSVDEFEAMKKKVDEFTPKHIQAYALTWRKPYRVGCMSITSALAFGFDKKFCSSQCGRTKSSMYYNSNSKTPYNDFNTRPTMMLAAYSVKEAFELIDNGKKSDASFPAGTGYLVSTSDRNRNVRSIYYRKIQLTFPKLPILKVIDADYIQHRNDVLFYFTGVKSVDRLMTNRFVPGAIADHLTSTGGMLTDSKQMSALKWIQAGATGTYGTVREPCNHRQKFPNPAIAINRYINGERLIEAYWKSVAWPGEGVFVGEPLAAPYMKSAETQIK